MSVYGKTVILVTVLVACIFINFIAVLFWSTSARESSTVNYSELEYIMTVFLVLSCLIAFVALVNLKRQLGKSLREMVSMTVRLRDGDLTIQDRMKSNDEIERMRSALREMADNLTIIVGEIVSVAGVVAGHSEEVSATVAQLSDGLDEKTKQIEQSATASVELSRTVTEVANNAGDAAKAANESVLTADKGKSVVAQTVVSMSNLAETVDNSSKVIEKLGERSRQIGDIINVINEIAGQTNLLALNAVIEAARAGEQGRGFAVVADEVRKLAEKTGRATGEISEMIKGIQDETSMSVEIMKKGKSEAEAGLENANKARMALENIVQASQQCLSMVQSIASVTEEESAVIEQVSGSMEDVSKLFRTSRAAIRQITDSTNDLARKSSELMQFMSWFKIGENPAFVGDSESRGLDYYSGNLNKSSG